MSLLLIFSIPTFIAVALCIWRYTADVIEPRMGAE
jgi:hypothetical protein